MSGPTIPRVNRQEIVSEVSNIHTVLDREFVGEFRSNDLTPSVMNVKKFKCGSGNQLITFFDDGQDGQTIEILGNGSIRVEYNSNLFTNTGSTKTLDNGKIYRFTQIDSKWYEQSGSDSSGVATSFDGVLGLVNGGTGLREVVLGDMLYAPDNFSLTKLGIGSEGQVLRVASGIPAWSFATLITQVGALNLGSIIAGFGDAAFNLLVTVGSPGAQPDISTKIHVRGPDGSGTRILADNYNDVVNYGCDFTGRRARGTQAAPSAVLAGDKLANIGGSGYGTSDFSALSSGTLGFHATETHSATAQGTKSIFGTTLNGTTTRVNRWTIEDNGHLFAAVDNVTDIGATGANRPRTGYFATSLIIGSPGAVSGKLSIGGSTRYLQTDTTTAQPFFDLFMQGDGATAGMAQGYRVRSYDAYAGTFVADHPRASRIAGRRFDGTIASPTNTKSGMVLFQLVAGGYDGTNVTSPTTICAVATENYSATAFGAKWLFRSVKVGTDIIDTVLEIESGIGLTLMQSTLANILWNTDGAGNIGATGATRPDKIYAKTGLYSALLDSDAAVDLVIKRNNVTQLTLGSLLASFAGNVDVASGKVYKVNGTQVVSAQGAAIADASGGAIIDAEARTAINALLARIRSHGLIAT